MRINHNYCIKLVRLVIFIYDARSHIHQIDVHVISYHVNLIIGSCIRAHFCVDEIRVCV